MAENKKTSRPTASNKYSLYAGREEAVNWGQIAGNLTKGLETIASQREAAKQKILDDTNAAMTELSEIADLQSGSMNRFVLDGSDYSKNTLQANMDLVRRGILKPKDYMMIMQAQKDGYKRLSNYAKNYDAKYKEGMERIQNEDAAGLEEFFRSTGFSFGNVKNKKLWTDPGTGDLILVEMIEDPQCSAEDKKANKCKMVMPSRKDYPDNFTTPAQMLNMIDYKEDSRDLNEDVKNLVTNNLAEVITADINGMVLSGKDVTSIENFRQIFDEIDGESFVGPDGKKMTFEVWLNGQAKAVAGDPNAAAEYLFNSGQDYTFTLDPEEAKKDPKKILAISDGGPPTLQLTEAQKKEAIRLAANQINSQLDFIVKKTAGAGQQESGTGAGERNETENTVGYIKDLNTVLTGDTATAKQTLQGMIEVSNTQRGQQNPPLPTIEGFDMTKDYVIFYMSDGNNIKRERGTFDDPDTADVDEGSKTSIKQDIAGIYDILVPGGTGIKTGLSDNEIFDIISKNKIQLGESGEGFGIGESITEIDNIGSTTQKKFTDGSTGTILSIVDKKVGDAVDVLDTDNQVKVAVEQAFTNFQTKQSRINQDRAGITEVNIKDAGGNKIVLTYKVDGELIEEPIEVGENIAENGKTKEAIAQAISTAIHDFNKTAYDLAQKKGGSRGARMTFKDWAVKNPRKEDEAFKDYTKRYYNSYTLN